MKYNLTDNQKQLARWLVKTVRAGSLPESFAASISSNQELLGSFGRLPVRGDTGGFQLSKGSFDALVEDRLLLKKEGPPTVSETMFLPPVPTYTLTARCYIGVDTNFAEDNPVSPVSTLAQPHPTEISISLDRLRSRFPDAKTLGFLVMRFTDAAPFSAIVRAIKVTAEKHGITVVRADENEFHADLWSNVRTHLHGCGFGIAVYERIESETPNANVGLEVGYLMAMNKPVLLLKDRILPSLQADLAGKLYKHFDPHDPEGTIPDQLERWLRDNGILV